MFVHSDFQSYFPFTFKSLYPSHIKPPGLQNLSACCIPKKTLPTSAMENWITLAPLQLGGTRLIFFNGLCSPEGLWWLVAPLQRLTCFCTLCSLPLTLAHSRMSKKSKCLFFWIFSNSRSSLRDSFRSWITLSGTESVKVQQGQEMPSCKTLNAKLKVFHLKKSSQTLWFECKPHPRR